MSIAITEADELEIEGTRYQIEAVIPEASNVPYSEPRTRKATEIVTVFSAVYEGRKVTGLLADLVTYLGFPVSPLDAKLRNSPGLQMPMKTMQTWVTDGEIFVHIMLIDKTFTS